MYFLTGENSLDRLDYLYFLSGQKVAKTHRSFTKELGRKLQVSPNVTAFWGKERHPPCPKGAMGVICSIMVNAAE